MGFEVTLRLIFRAKVRGKLRKKDKLTRERKLR